MNLKHHNSKAVLQKKAYVAPACRSIGFVPGELLLGSNPTVNDSKGDDDVQFSKRKENNNKTIWNSSSDENNSTWLK